MFVQYSAAFRNPSPGENSSSYQAPTGQAFKETIISFCERENLGLGPEEFDWFSSVASSTLEYLKGQLSILEALDSRGVLRLYTDQIPTVLRLHGDVFARGLGRLLKAGGLNANVSVVDTRIAIEITFPQDPVAVGRRLGDQDFKAVPFGKAKEEIDKLPRSKIDREEIRNRGCLNHPTLGLEQRLVIMDW